MGVGFRKEIIKGLREFTEPLEGRTPILEKFTCRKVTLDLQPVPYNPGAVKATRSLLAARAFSPTGGVKISD